MAGRRRPSRGRTQRRRRLRRPAGDLLVRRGRRRRGGGRMSGGRIGTGQLEAAGRALAAEAARFAAMGWMRGTSGNLSVVLDRDPLRLAVTVSGLDKGELTSAD